MGPTGSMKKGRLSRHFPGESLWRCATWPAVSPDAGDDCRIRTQSDSRTDAAGTLAQSSQGRIYALGVSDLWLSLYPQAGWHAAPGGEPPRTGRRGPRDLWLVAP